ncbi:hypothetical protein EYF80_007083 [Liparis tanakae]|uniref:Uncharacterized protein n=1 Tax=Liparis tanakae TaxID=230148 RepID=A0A4Z2IX72_9TELE|nr:hypothetical protein EYF80_007083 [Liparis tanakae]
MRPVSFAPVFRSHTSHPHSESQLWWNEPRHFAQKLGVKMPSGTLARRALRLPRERVPPVDSQSENRRALMFILVTPMSRSGAERPRPGVTGHSHSRSDSSSRSSRPKVASLSIRRCRRHVCSIFSSWMSPRSRMSCIASCWSCRRMSV